MSEKKMAKQKVSKGNALALVQSMGQVKGIALMKLREAAEQMGAAAVGPLKSALARSPRRDVRWEAAKALGHLADPTAIACLIKALSDEDADVGRVAAEALLAFKDKALRPLLRALVRHSDSAGLRGGARHILRVRRRLRRGDPFKELIGAIELDATHEDSAVAAHRILASGLKF
jgi:HEAT repeat protein